MRQLYDTTSVRQVVQTMAEIDDKMKVNRVVSTAHQLAHQLVSPLALDMMSSNSFYRVSNILSFYPLTKLYMRYCSIDNKRATTPTSYLSVK